MQLHLIDAKNKEGHHNTLYINEGGLYRLMLRSRLRKAEEFAEWVTHTVLPSIRKYGEYKLVTAHKRELHDVLEKITFLEEEVRRLRKGQCKADYPDGGVVYAIDYSTKHREVYRIGMSTDMKARKQLYDTHTLHDHEIAHIVEFDCPLQLEACVRSVLLKYRYYADKKDFFECSLSTLKGAFTSCQNSINKADAKDNQVGGSKQGKKRTPNLIEKKIIIARREEARLRKRIIKLNKKLRKVGKDY